MTLWPRLRSSDWLLEMGGGNPDFKRHWTTMFDDVYEGRFDTWDYQWLFSCWTQHGLTALPHRNLVTNIGFNQSATHTTRYEAQLANLPLRPITFPLNHPRHVMRDHTADRWTDANIFRIHEVNWLRKGLGRLRRRLQP
ncbi:MAG: hypothetical protein H6638_05850 [Ardenticatenales bacterium]|nr:hypothetical protein [Ardenticatenales bacterium]